MSRTTLALVLVLVVLAVVTLAGSGLPGPNPPPGPCTQNSDCPYPQICQSGACSDPALPGLLAAAQAAAAALYNTLQGLNTAFAADGVFDQHLAALGVAAADMGLSSFSGAALQADLTSGRAAAGKALGDLAVPGCDPTQSMSCGYYAQLGALTPASPPGAFIVVAGGAPSAVADVLGVVDAVAPVAGDLAWGVNFVTAEAEAARRKLSAAVQQALSALSNDITQLDNVPQVLAAQVAAVKQTGQALYSHFIGTAREIERYCPFASNGKRRDFRQPRRWPGGGALRQAGRRGVQGPDPRAAGSC